MPSGCMTSPTLSRLSVTKPVSSCPILWTWIGRWISRTRHRRLSRCPRGASSTPFVATGDDNLWSCTCVLSPRSAADDAEQGATKVPKIYPHPDMTSVALAATNSYSAYPSALERFSGVPPPAESLPGGRGSESRPARQRMTSVCSGFFVARIDEVLMNRVRRRPRVIAKCRAYQRRTRAVPACCADRRQEMPICRHFGEAL